MIHICVATKEGQAGLRYSHKQNNIHRAVEMPGTPLFTGGRATHAASCMSIYMSHVVAPAPQHGNHCGTCPLSCVSLHHPSRESLPV